MGGKVDSLTRAVEELFAENSKQTARIEELFVENSKKTAHIEELFAEQVRQAREINVLKADVKVNNYNNKFNSQIYIFIKIRPYKLPQLQYRFAKLLAFTKKCLFGSIYRIYLGYCPNNLRNVMIIFLINAIHLIF